MGPLPTAATDAGSLHGLSVVGMLAIFASVWLITDPYAGLVHDAKLYALQALAKLQPDVFRGDLFLRFQSQDDFTLFPWLYAPVASALGIESAAAVLTLVLSVLWLVLAFLLARALSGTRLALLALGFVAAIPGWYGSHEVIHVGEMYLSARLPAEVAGLGALLARTADRRWLSVAFAVLSTMLHPLMGIAIVGLLMLYEMNERFGAVAVPYSALAAVAGGTIVALALPVSPLDMDAQWQAVVYSRSGWLFPEKWRFLDWQYHGLILLTLAIALRVITAPRSKALVHCALWLGVSGLALAGVAAVLADRPVLLRAQTWRWMWVVTLISIVVLPLVFDRLVRQRRGPSDPSAAALLAAGWLMPNPAGGLLAAAALVLTLLPPNRLVAHQRPLLWGALAVLGLTCASVLVPGLQFAIDPLDTNAEPLPVQRLVNLIGGGSVGLLLVTGTWVLALRLQGRLAPRLAFALAAVLLLSAIVPRAIRDWNSPKYPPSTAAAFSHWRELIPPSAEVLWQEDAMRTWLFLGRRNYLSQDQLAGIVYSPAMMDAFVERSQGLREIISPKWWTLEDLTDEAGPQPLTASLLASICHSPGLDFVVYDVDLGNALSTAMMPGREVALYLYDCSRIRATENPS